jgi:hypothetical protein
MRPIDSSKLAKDWAVYPKFRHNLWTTYDDQPDVTYLVVSHSKFEIPKSEADTFLRFRGHCTGHHTIPEIARKSEVAEETTRAIVASLIDAQVSRPAYRPLSTMTAEEIRSVLFAACRIWGEQLSETYIAADIKAGKLSADVMRGWLLETYHYIRNFPDAVAEAAAHATGELRDVLTEYARQERGHETFILKCLKNMGFKAEEVEDSIPLVSTRLVDMLMRELFRAAPAAALLVAAVVEAQDLQVEDATAFREAIQAHYGVPADALLPLQEHMLIDAELGHGQLMTKYAHLIDFKDETLVHNVVNRMHDIKHAFDLQSLEISSYYAHPGNYVPRQFVDFFAV